MVPDQHRISLPNALEMVQRARRSPPAMVNGWRVEGGIIKEILAQPGAGGLRVYMAATEDGVATLVVVGVDEAGHDMTDGAIAEHLFPCPPICDEASPFHSP